MILGLIVSVASVQALPLAGGDQPAGQAAMPKTPEYMAGWCVTYLRERTELQTTRSAKLDPLQTRSRSLDSAMAILSLPTARASQAQTLREQASGLDEQINQLARVLEGYPSEAWYGQHRSVVQEKIASLFQSRSRKALLAQAHGAQGQDRATLLEQLRLEKEALAARIDAITDPFEQRLKWLREQVQQHDDAFEQAMRGFGLIAEVQGASVQAVRVHSVIAEGRLTYSWTDRRGAMVASAHLWLRAQPDEDIQPPVVLGRYPVLLQNRQEAQISAGHFLIEFRVSIDELSGEQRVLETATKLLDIDALGRLTPRVGHKGLD